jgi:hypothetical protein
MTEDIGAVRRLHGMMQTLLAERLGSLPVEPHGPREIVTEPDAIEAMFQLSAVLDETEATGLVVTERLVWASALLMVILDYVRPLPHAGSAGNNNDAVGEDVQEMVDALREGQLF